MKKTKNDLNNLTGATQEVVRAFARNEKLKEFLKIVVAAGGIAACIACPIIPIALKPFFGKEREEYEVSRVIKTLNKRGFLSVEKSGKIQVTREGKAWLDLSKLDELTIEQDGKWDKFFWMVIFDIPEQKRLAREFFRKFLKRVGFKRYQKSVFIFPYRCEKEVREAAEILGIIEFVSIAKIDKIDKEDELKELFEIIT